MKNILRIGMLLCSFLLASVGWVAAEEADTPTFIGTNEDVEAFKSYMGISGNWQIIYGNGFPITISKSENATADNQVTISFSGEGAPGPIKIEGDTQAIVFGGSKEKDLNGNTSITMNSGKVGYLIGGGWGTYGKSPADPKTANVQDVTINVTGGTVGLIYSGGLYRANVDDIHLTFKNATASHIYCGGFDQGQTSNTIKTSWDSSVNHVTSSTLEMDNAAVKGYLFLGGGQGYSYSKTVNATISNSTLRGGVLGTGSNGRSDNVTAELNNVTFAQAEGSSMMIEIAALNRGVVGDVDMTFNGCTFPSNTSIYKCYAGATYQYDGKSTVSLGKVTMTFTNNTNTPTVGISSGLDDANVTINGAPVEIAAFDAGNSIIDEDFTIATDKTWAFNNGLTIADNVTLTNHGTLEVRVSNADQLAAAVKAGANKVTMAAGDYVLSSQLTIKKAITLEGAGMEITTIKAGTNDWSYTDDTKYLLNLVDITGGENGQTVTLKDLTISGSKRSGLNVQTAMTTQLVDVKLANNAGAGMVVHSKVEATGLHTESNGWGGVNVDVGTPQYSTISFKFDDTSTFDDENQIWAEAGVGHIENPTSAVILPSEQANLWKILTRKNSKNEDVYVWTDNKLTTEVFANFPNKSTWTGPYTFVYANGNPILITQGETAESGETVKIEVVNADGSKLSNDEEEYVVVPVSKNPVIIGGSKNATVASSTIYMNSGKVAHLFGGGYGEANGSVTAAITGDTKIIITGGEAHNVFGGGLYKSKSQKVTLDVKNMTMDQSAWIICGGMESGKTGVKYPTFENATNTVTEGVLSINGGTYCYIGVGGTDGYGGYVKKATATIKNATQIVGLFGNGSNGGSDEVSAIVENCTFITPWDTNSYPIEIAAINRGHVKDVAFTFTNCKFPESGVASYIGGTINWKKDYKSSAVEVVSPGTISYTFDSNCTNIPTMGLSDGLENANITITGAPVSVAKFSNGADAATATFSIASGKTWTFNNGLTFATDDNAAILTNNGTLIVKGVTEAADLQALVKSKANEITTTTLQASEVPAAFSGMTELPKKMVIYAADKAVYMTKDEADVAAAMSGKATAYLIKKDGNTYTLSAEVSAPTTPPAITNANKPQIVGEPEAGKTLSAYALKGGIATVGDVQVAGSFTWANPDSILAAGKQAYGVIFTPVDLTLYSTVKTSIEIDAVQYYTVTAGTCENGKVIIENASTANKYKAGTTLNVRAEADPHYQFKQWGRDITGTNNTITYSVAADKELTATFEAITHEVTVSSVTGGTLSVKNNGTTISSPVPEGTILTVVATPANDKELESLNYQIGNTTYPIRNGQVEVSAAMTISASFKDKANYLLKLATGVANGKILLFDEQGNAINMGTAVATGTKITAVAVPDKGYSFFDVTVEGATRHGSYYEVNSSDVTFRATFAKAIYSISTEGTVTLTKVSGSGTATTSCHYGDVYTATATPAAGNKLISLLVNGKEMANGGQFTVTGDMKIKANEVALTPIQIDETKQTYVYDGEAKKFAIRSVPMGLTGFTVTYQKNGEAASTEAPTNAGTYKVIIARDVDESFAAFNKTIDAGLVIEQAELKGINAPTWDATSSKWTGSSLGTWTGGSAITEDKIYNVTFHPTDLNFKDIEFEGIKDATGLTVVSMPSSGLRSSTLRAGAASLSINATNGAVSLWNGTQKITSGSTVYVGQTLTVKGLPNAGYSSNATWTINNGTATPGTSTTITLGSGENNIMVNFPAKTSIENLPTVNNSAATPYTGSVILPSITTGTIQNGWTYVIKAGGVVVDHPTDADTYEVYASRSEDEQYKAVVNQSIGSYTISKKAITDISITSASPILKGQTLAQSTLTGTAPVAGTFAWVSPTMVPADDATPYAVIFTPNDTKNYEVGSSVDLKQNVTFYSGSTTAAARVITFAPAENGTFVVKVNGVAVETGAQVSAGDQVVVETTPNSGYSASVSYTGITNGVVDASGNVAVTVTFTRNSTPVTPGGGGTVDPEPEIPTVSNPVVAERTATTAAITWEKVSGATSYKLFLYAKKTDSTPLKTYEFDKDGKLKATTISFTLTGLEEGKSYYIETAAYNALGTLLVKKSVELSATPTGIEAISEGSQLYTVKGAIVVAPAEPLQVAIYSVTGQTLFNDEVSYLTQVPAQAGIYVVVIQKGKERITEKVFVK